MDEEMKTVDEQDSEKSANTKENNPESMATNSNIDSQEEDTEIDDGGDEINADANGRAKSYRKRQRHHYNQIRAQLEFYFGDANLCRDGFLMQKVRKDPFVPLELFLKFNKIKTLTDSVEEIKKSLTNSTLLELDELGQKVRRRAPIPEDRNVDALTVYVESLPPTADHDWVRKIFEQFGAVAYVSLPRCRRTEKIKGFAFIEFEHEESVAKALKAFEEFNGVLSEIQPSELATVKAYLEEKKEAMKKQHKSVATKSNKKRKEENEEETSAPDAKRIKIADDDTTPKNEESTEASTATEDESKPMEHATTEANNKKRRRKKKSKTARKKDFDPKAEAAYHELKILSKKQWKALRNKYLNLQRLNLGALKQSWARRPRIRETNDTEQLSSPPSAVGGAAAAVKGEKKLQKMNMNFYGAGAGEDETQQQQLQPKATASKVAEPKPEIVEKKPPPFTFEAGIIVEVTHMEPCINVKEFRAEMKQYSSVKYIDVKEGNVVTHLRLETPTAAEEFVRQVACAEYKMKILTGDSEKDYWKRIEQHREMKINKNVKVKQKRGREKVQKLIAKHTHFDENLE